MTAPAQSKKEGVITSSERASDDLFVAPTPLNSTRSRRFMNSDTATLRSKCGMKMTTMTQSQEEEKEEEEGNTEYWRGGAAVEADNHSGK